VDVIAPPGVTIPPEVRACYLEALSGQVFPCLAGDEVWQECVVCLF
jgi:hypothetical protein